MEISFHNSCDKLTLRYFVVVVVVVIVVVCVASGDGSALALVALASAFAAPVVLAPVVFATGTTIICDGVIQRLRQTLVTMIGTDKGRAIKCSPPAAFNKTGRVHK
jgi:choline-glycine betaine transporter